MNNEFLAKYKLDHIGIAVHSLSEGRKPYDALGFGEITIEDVPAEKVRVGMFELKNQARVELLEPMGTDSPIAGFLQKRGPGVHHICFQVPDVNEAIAQAKKLGMVVINDPPNPGAHNCLVSFIHPKSMGGVLVELSQKLGAKP